MPLQYRFHDLNNQYWINNADLVGLAFDKHACMLIRYLLLAHVNIFDKQSVYKYNLRGTVALLIFIVNVLSILSTLEQVNAHTYVYSFQRKF